MYKECYSALKRKKILTHAYSETLRTFHGVEYASHGKTNPAQSHFLEVLGVLRTGEEDGGGRCQRKGNKVMFNGDRVSVLQNEESWRGTAAMVVCP